ncbi:uncharacterized protein G2W53_004415 [Senna tora]|uniref:Uncharacterized protein n=1 Tax=Senna tora TaxID=362788 RepID=A0A835CK63_9FABA|nr:uncharacterized protein G2W53_004415 [Senna tora]
MLEDKRSCSTQDKRMQLWQYLWYKSTNSTVHEPWLTLDTEPKSPKQTKSNYGEEEHNSPPRIGNKAERTEQRWRSGEEEDKQSRVPPSNCSDGGGCRKLRDEAAAAAAKEESDEETTDESDQEIEME